MDSCFFCNQIKCNCEGLLDDIKKNTKDSKKK